MYTDAEAENGYLFTDGSGGTLLDSRVTGIRVMDPVTSGKYVYPHGYVSYFNELGQAVSPFTGRTIAPSDPLRCLIFAVRCSHECSRFRAAALRRRGGPQLELRVAAHYSHGMERRRFSARKRGRGD
jgi:hypothetical protein